MANPHVYAKKSLLVSGALVDRYIGVDPSHPTVVYADRTTANGWEAMELAPRDKGFSARFLDANVYLSMNEAGELQTRPAVGGSDEVFFCTNQPDGSALLYRFQNDAALVEPVLKLEAVK